MPGSSASSDSAPCGGMQETEAAAFGLGELMEAVEVSRD